jgi:hypothetical protein
LAIGLKKNFDVERQGLLEELRESRHVKANCERKIALVRLHEFVFRWCTIVKLKKFQSYHTLSIEKLD